MKKLHKMPWRILYILMLPIVAFILVLDGILILPSWILTGDVFLLTDNVSAPMFKYINGILRRD
jgi:hypothetical protein